MKSYLDLLGHEVEDKVSDYKGVVISISYDLYGRIQADVWPRELGENGLPKQGYWLDVSRLRVVSKKPPMERPSFEQGKVAVGKKGPAKLPVKS
ncbi:MAG: hypothetical protein DRG39_04070 [Deltaproteobacteria bacterium]|nr:MAG: hypothetical protein DRG39_04070 [Deltaproteobacteria bacterium]